MFFALFTSDSVIILIRALFLIAPECRCALLSLPALLSPLIDTCLKICINSAVESTCGGVWSQCFLEVD